MIKSNIEQLNNQEEETREKGENIKPIEIQDSSFDTSTIREEDHKKYRDLEEKDMEKANEITKELETEAEKIYKQQSKAVEEEIASKRESKKLGFLTRIKNILR